MDDIIEMSGRLLRFDVVDKNGTLFPKDCEISFSPADDELKMIIKETEKEQ